MRMLLVIFVCLLWISVSSAYRFIGVIPFQSPSHFIIFETLMKGLVSKGHQVDVISAFPQKRPYPNYTDIAELKSSALRNNMSYEYMTRMNNNRVNFFAIVAGNELCEAHLGHPAIQKLVRNPPKDPPYDAMIMEVCKFILLHTLRKYSLIYWWAKMYK